MSVGTPGALPAVPAQAAIYGQGVTYPLAYNPNTGRLLLTTGVNLVTQAMQSILQTAPGERPLQPDYGADVGTFEPSDAGRLKARIEQNTVDHEPRVRTVEVKSRLGGDPNTLSVDVSFTVYGQATPQTLTYPYFSGPA